MCYPFGLAFTIFLNERGKVIQIVFFRGKVKKKKVVSGRHISEKAITISHAGFCVKVACS